MSTIERNISEKQVSICDCPSKDSISLWIAHLGLDLAFLFVMVILLVFALLADGGHVRWFQASLALPVSMMLISLTVRFLKNKESKKYEAREVIRDWIPFLMIAFIYENLRDLTGILVNFDIAHLLYQSEFLIFGGQPTVWAGKFYHPIIVDVMAFFYALYFTFPLIIMFVLSVQKQRWDFRKVSFALSIAFVFGFLGYVLTPASPPRFTITDYEPAVLNGVFIFNRLQSAWDGLSVITGGAFPSLHVGISSVALIYAFVWRNRSKLFKTIWYVYLPSVVLLWISTVYLRHHWFLDIVAGWLVALAGYYIASMAVDWWKAKLQQ